MGVEGAVAASRRRSGARGSGGEGGAGRREGPLRAAGRGSRLRSGDRNSQSQSPTIVLVPAESHIEVTGDPEDDNVLATGVRAEAHFIVTGDGKLRRRGTHTGIQLWPRVSFW